jgi:hypothetical protein
MFNSLIYVYNVYFLWPVQNWLKTLQPIPPYQNPCEQDYDTLPEDPAQEFVLNESWPFPHHKP